MYQYIGSDLSPGQVLDDPWFNSRQRELRIGVAVECGHINEKYPVVPIVHRVHAFDSGDAFGDGREFRRTSDWNTWLLTTGDVDKLRTLRAFNSPIFREM